MKQAIYLVLFFCFTNSNLCSQEFSVARVWNEMVLNAIRNDFARPTVHARNLFHTSIAMYDIFAAYDDYNDTYFLGKTVGGYNCEFDGVPLSENVEADRREAISYAVYRLIHHRFKDAPSKENIFFNVDLIFAAFGFDKDFRDTDYGSGNPAALGNYVAQELISFGLQDGSNESNGYENTFYEPVNPLLNPFRPYSSPTNTMGNERLSDPNRWQQISIPGLVDQANNLVPGGTLPFLSPEWGYVTPFSLSDSDKIEYEKAGNIYPVYHDPGPPHLLDTLMNTTGSEEYKWGFSLVVQWKTHTILDSFFYDISPASLGNIEKLPNTNSEYKSFYKFEEGGDASRGYDLNPRTGLPYAPQYVQRGDYSRVVAEWWADGPESETPPGHWFTILNYVSDQPELVKKYKGEGDLMSDLEWDVKAYFTLGGAMHDAAVSAWSIKGYYDYIRPISAIRYMIDKGQSTDPTSVNYDLAGFPLIPGVIEQILDGDALLAFDRSNYGNLKVLASLFEDQRLYSPAAFWSPYQPINFITPPFAGYVSGHSTFSRAAAEVLTLFTGDEFFPGGLGSYDIPADTYLETAMGPSDSLSLQWATYRDAAHQSALSRIWGGIHPPIDDIPGRKIGIKVGNSAFELANSLFGRPMTSTEEVPGDKNIVSCYPNPIQSDGLITFETGDESRITQILITGYSGDKITLTIGENQSKVKYDLSKLRLSSGVYNFQVSLSNGTQVNKKVIVLTS